MNFNLHAQVWRGDRTELWRNIEVRTLALNIAFLSVLATLGMGAGGYYTVYCRRSCARDCSTWSPRTPAPGTRRSTRVSGPTSSGVPGSRRSCLRWRRAALSHRPREESRPCDSASSRKQWFTRSKRRFRHARRASRPSTTISEGTCSPRRSWEPPPSIFIMYTITYVTGGLIGAAYGFGAADAIFESISATANVGLSAGITSPSDADRPQAASTSCRCGRGGSSSSRCWCCYAGLAERAHGVQAGERVRRMGLTLGLALLLAAAPGDRECR